MRSAIIPGSMASAPTAFLEGEIGKLSHTITPIQTSKDPESSTLTEITTKGVGVQCNLCCTKKTCTSSKISTEKIINDYLTNKYFSKVRIKQIMNDGKGKRYREYTEKEICFGLVLKSIISKAFNLLQGLQLFPCPSVSTQKRWLDTSTIKPGISESMF